MENDLKIKIRVLSMISTFKIYIIDTRVLLGNLLFGALKNFLRITFFIQAAAAL